MATQLVKANQNQITAPQNTGLVIEGDLPVLSKETIKKYFCKDATDQDLIMALKFCEQYKLNPWKKEIYFIKIGQEPLAPVISYEMILAKASTFPQYDGYETIIEGNETAKNLEITCLVYRKDRRMPFKFVARYAEFVMTTREGTPNKFWAKRPKFMLEKVAIAHAHKRAFPKEFEGLDIGEGLPERESFEDTYSQYPALPTTDDWLSPDDDLNAPVTPDQIKRFFTIATNLRLTKAEIKSMLISKGYIKESTKELTQGNYELACEELEVLAKNGCEGQIGLGINTNPTRVD